MQREKKREPRARFVFPPPDPRFFFFFFSAPVRVLTEVEWGLAWVGWGFSSPYPVSLLLLLLLPIATSGLDLWICQCVECSSKPSVCLSCPSVIWSRALFSLFCNIITFVSALPTETELNCWTWRRGSDCKTWGRQEWRVHESSHWLGSTKQTH